MIDFIFKGARQDRAPYSFEKSKLAEAHNAPLLDCPALAKELGLGGLTVRCGEADKLCSLRAMNDICFIRKNRHKRSFVTAAAGEWGVSAAAAAEYMGVSLTVFLPKNTLQRIITKIESYKNVKAIVTEAGWYDTVNAAKAYSKAMEQPFITVNDNDALYLAASELTGFTHIVLPEGTGELAAAIMPYLTQARLITVEPQSCGAIFRSVKQGKTALTEPKQTVMATLACDYAEESVWKTIGEHAEALCLISDDVALLGSRVLKKYGVRACVSGSAAMGLIYSVMTLPMLMGVRVKLGLNENARMLVLSM